MNVNFGDDAFRRGVGKAMIETRAATAMAINDVALEIAAKADDLVPFDLGTLSTSQKIDPPTIRNLTATITYGGPAAPYALVQHENMEYQHRAGRSAKYLERPAREVGRTLDDKIKQLVKQVL